jgi:hypothetical protein
MEFLADKVVIPKGVEGWDQTVRAGMAELLGQPVERMKHVFDNQFTSARHIWAAKTMLESASKQVADFAKGYDPARATVEDRAKAFRMVQQLADLYAYNTGIRAEAGRALNASKIMSAESKKLISQLDEIVNIDAGGAPRVDQIMQALSAATSPAEATQIARVAVHGNKGWNSAVELWMSSVLSGAGTILTNTLGTAFNLVKELPEREVGAAFGSARTAISRAGTDGSVEQIVPGESVALFWGFLEGLPEALVTFGRALKSGDPVFSAGKRAELAASGEISTSKLPEVRNPAISAENYGLPSVFKQGATFRGATNELVADPVTIPGSIVDVLGATIRSPLNLIQSTDEFYKVLAYRMQLNARAYRDTMSYGVDGIAEKVSIYQELKRNPPDDIKFDAMNFADYVTFQKAMGEAGRLSQNMINRGWTQFDAPLLKFVVPFQKTLSNIFKQGILERTPIGYISREVSEDIAAGGARADAARARFYAGSSLVMYMAWEASKGNITGPAPKQEGQKTAFYNSGRRPYSFRVPDGFDENGEAKYKWVGYNKMEPAAFPIALGSTIGSYMYYMDPENPEHERTLEQMVNTAVGGVGTYITDRQFMIGVSDFVDAIRGSKSAFDWAGKYVASWVPAASFDVVRKNDRIIRDTHEFFDKAMARMPGFAEDLPPSVNVWGEPVLRDKGLFFGWADPVKVSAESKRPIEREIYRLGVEGVDTGDGNKRIFPEALISLPERAIDGYRLSPAQYHEMMMHIGPMALEQLNEVVSRPDYQEAPPFAKATMIRAMWEKITEAGRAQMKVKPELIDHAEKLIDLNKTMQQMGIK